MTKTKFKTMLLILCSLLLSVLTCAFVVSFKTAKATQQPLQAEYNLNSTLEIPNYEIAYEGGTVKATEYSLEYPDGVFMNGQVHELNMSGEYTVHYSAKVDGALVTAEEKFLVPYDMYSPDNVGTNTTVYYGKNAQFPDHNEGLVVSLVSGDVLQFNQIIDLSEATQKDNLLSFYITPLTKDMYDATRLIFRFTDIHDENNWLEVTYKCLYNVRSWAIDQTWIHAQTNGNPNIATFTDGTPRINNYLWGWAYYKSFCRSGATHNLSFDNATKTLWTDAVVSAEMVGKPLANLADDTVLTTPWEGFTTGEVKMSVYATSYNAPSFNFVVTSLAGYELSEMQLYDTLAPQISIDLVNNEKAPEGMKNMPYKVFEATATDDYSASVKVESNVYYHYGQAGQVNVSVKNGWFTPTLSGTYTIEYKAKDAFGNETIETVDVNVRGDGNGMDFEILNPTNAGSEGEEIKLFDGVEIAKAKGLTQISVTATCNGKTAQIGKDYKFTPLMSGTYKVTVSVSDYIETVSKSFDIVVAESGKTVYVDEVVLVDYFIRGQEYKLPMLCGYDLAVAEPQKVDSKIFVLQDNGEEQEVGAEPFTVTAKTEVKVIYRIANSTHDSEKSYTVPVIDAIMEDGNLDVAKYFKVLSGNGNVIATENDVTISASEDVCVKFANAVQVEGFETNFRWGVSQNFKGVNLYFTDSMDSSVRVKFTYTWINEIGYIAINDGAPRKVPVNTNSSDKSLLTLGYKNDVKQVYGRTTLMMNVAETVYGEKFEGFASNMAYVEYELFGVTGEAELCILKINNQSMFNFEMPDFINGELFLKRTNGDKDFGENVIIYGARCYDVLSSKTELALTVRDPEGFIVTANDGTVLDGSCDPSKDYEIKMEQYGAYTVEFYIKDGAGNEQVYMYGFSCVDKDAPTIQVDTSNASAKLGSMVSVRKYTVFDNMTDAKNLTVSRYVLAPDYSMSAVIGESFKVTQKGVYTVYYYCRDELNNLAIQKYYVIVE